MNQVEQIQRERDYLLEVVRNIHAAHLLKGRQRENHQHLSEATKIACRTAMQNCLKSAEH
jgi:hypothetical protein